MSGAGNWHDVVSLSQHPRQCQLRGCALVFFSHLFDFRNKLEILLEVFALKAWVLAPEIILGQIFDALDLPSKKSAAQRTVGDEADVEKPQCIKQSLLGITGPQRILRL